MKEINQEKFIRPIGRLVAVEMDEIMLDEVGGGFGNSGNYESGKFTKVHASADVDYEDHTTTDFTGEN